ncbi:sensor histidine kinase [Spirochaeta africana]|uniref:histidine kinase n=1 Tax=Spirochaeta africana (strain ATCC 700263 / DSM 8902 / Z-7692) TaxID=889378 RepID=H9UGE7_SPIAZ|nr:HAMP domain-containing sensor histidine kinase [Spirochaeta africana]AFG36590.1 histidine kinase [Spirochaeta africana DSM 8902]
MRGNRGNLPAPPFGWAEFRQNSTGTVQFQAAHPLFHSYSGFPADLLERDPLAALRKLGLAADRVATLMQRGSAAPPLETVPPAAAVHCGASMRVLAYAAYPGSCTVVIWKQELPIAELVRNPDIEHYLVHLAHELRTPLTGVVGMTELLQATSLDPQQLMFLVQLQESAQRLQHVLDDTLHHLPTQAVTDPPGRGEAPASVLRTAAAPYLRLAERRQLATHVDIEPGLELPASCPTSLLARICSALMSNAVQYTEQGAVSLLAGFAWYPNRQIQLEICDTGPGFDTAYLPGSGCRTDGDTRTGGLQQVYSLAERVRGSVTLNSSPEGTRVRVLLPCSAVTRVQRLPAHLTVIIVGYEGATRRSVFSWLRRLGHVPAVVSPGHQTEAALEQASFDAAVILESSRAASEPVLSLLPAIVPDSIPPELLQQACYCMMPAAPSFDSLAEALAQLRWLIDTGAARYRNTVPALAADRVR